MGNQANDELGGLGWYGVVVVPAPRDGSGGWFVTLATWNDKLDGYSTGVEGPIFESREEAMREASRLLDWLAEHGNEENLDRVWTRMHQALAAGEHPEIESLDPRRRPTWPY